MMNYETSTFTTESNLDNSVNSYYADSELDLPEAPESWDLDDFSDVLGNTSYEFH